MSVYACADLHGCYWAWEEIKNFLKPDDTLYFLGDAIDRGEQGWQIMKELLNDPRVIYIMGNHELMMLDAIGNASPKTFDPEMFRWDEAMYIWFQNGGEVTYNSFLADEERFDVIQKVKSLPFVTVYHNSNDENVYLLHAGCHYSSLNKLTEFDAVWNRTHYRLNNWDGHYEDIIVHGHTPIPMMVQEQDEVARFYDKDIITHTDDMIEPGAYWYAKGHKVNIDCGTVWTDCSVLLNLDTWDEAIFVLDKEEETT